MVFASSYVFDRLLLILNNEGAFSSLNAFEKLSKRYEEDGDLQKIYATLRTYLEDENPLVLDCVKSSLESIKNSRKIIESRYSYGYEWHPTRRP